MNRRHLLSLLDTYAVLFPAEAETVQRVRQLVTEHADCFARTCRPGHITGSGWVLSEDRRRCLLVHHRKLGKWLQPGGHADGQWDPLEVAVREVTEETGLRDLRMLPIQGCRVPIDIDVHAIPARHDDEGRLVEDAHWHFDVRFLLWTPTRQALVVSDESHEVRWVTPRDLVALTTERSVMRMLEKASVWMA